MAERTVVQKVSNATLYSDGCIRIDNVRLSYPHLDKPWAQDGGKPKYSGGFLLPKDSHQAAKDLCVKVIEDICKKEELGKLGSDRKFIRNGDDTGKDENEGMYVVNAREDNRPACRNQKGGVMTETEVKDKFYGGCWVNVLIRPWAQNSKDYGKRVNAGLVAVQFVRDGEAFGEGRVDDDGVWESSEESSDSGDDL